MTSETGKTQRAQPPGVPEAAPSAGAQPTGVPEAAPSAGAQPTGVPEAAPSAGAPPTGDVPGSPHTSHMSHTSYPSHASPAPPPKGFLPPHGGYERLISFRKARIIYDATLRFCERFVDPRSRTRDQMIQAARSGKQNILEGSQASGASKATELKLTSVARASLEELLEDYRDFLRVAGRPVWAKNSKEALFARRLGARRDAAYESYQPFIESRPAEVVANILICLIHQTNYLLDQQIRRLERDFLEEGGLRERMTRARLAVRSGQGREHPLK